MERGEMESGGKSRERGKGERVEREREGKGREGKGRYIGERGEERELKLRGYVMERQGERERRR